MRTAIGKAVIAIALWSAGAAQAASVFPSAANEVPRAWYADSIVVSKTHGAASADKPFPSAAFEHGSSLGLYAEAPLGASPSIAVGRPFAAPASADETQALFL